MQPIPSIGIAAGVVLAAGVAVAVSAAAQRMNLALGDTARRWQGGSGDRREAAGAAGVEVCWK